MTAAQIDTLLRLEKVGRITDDEFWRIFHKMMEDAGWRRKK